MNSDYKISLTAIDNIEILHQKWRQIEKESKCSFFLSWHWIESWLHTYQPNCELIEVHLQRKLVGLAIISKAVKTRYKIIHSNQVNFHQTGIATEDQIWIEYNDILTLKEHYSSVCKLIFEYFQDAPDCDELVFNGLLEKKAALFNSLSSFNLQFQWLSPTFSIDLQALRKTNKDYLPSLSKNTRYQIRRSHKEFNQLGELTLSRANSTEEALLFFDRAAVFHIKRWGNKAGESGFCNSKFTDFHKKLIQLNWHKEVIHLWKLQLCEQDIGYFYNFIYNDEVYFYLSGLKGFENSKLKPGLLGHSLCIQYYLEQGYKKYDFMGGDARYKRSLAQQSQSLCKVLLQKPKIKFFLEKKARYIKNRGRGIFCYRNKNNE